MKENKHMSFQLTVGLDMWGTQGLYSRALRQDKDNKESN